MHCRGNAVASSELPVLRPSASPAAAEEAQGRAVDDSLQLSSSAPPPPPPTSRSAGSASGVPLARLSVVTSASPSTATAPDPGCGPDPAPEPVLGAGPAAPRSRWWAAPRRPRPVRRSPTTSQRRVWGDAQRPQLRSAAQQSDRPSRRPGAASQTVRPRQGPRRPPSAAADEIARQAPPVPAVR